MPVYNFSWRRFLLLGIRLVGIKSYIPITHHWNLFQLNTRSFQVRSKGLKEHGKKIESIIQLFTDRTPGPPLAPTLLHLNHAQKHDYFNWKNFLKQIFEKYVASTKKTMGKTIYETCLDLKNM